MKKQSIILLFTLLISLHVHTEWIFEEIPAPTVIKDYAITSLAIGNKNFIWALGKRNESTTLFSWKQEKKTWEEFPKSLDHITGIAATKDNILFVTQKINSTGKLLAWNGVAWQESYSIDNATISSLAAVSKEKIYAVVNEKTYELNNDKWQQLGTQEGFREIATCPDGTLYARRFDFQAALNPETAFPAFSLQLVMWNGTQWQTIPTKTDKEKAVMSIALSDKNTIFCIVREEKRGGKAYKWIPETKKLDPLSDQSDFMSITAASDGTVWALQYAESPADRKLYSWVNKQPEIAKANPAHNNGGQANQNAIKEDPKIETPAQVATPTIISGPSHISPAPTVPTFIQTPSQTPSSPNIEQPAIQAIQNAPLPPTEIPQPITPAPTISSPALHVPPETTPNQPASLPEISASPVSQPAVLPTGQPAPQVMSDQKTEPLQPEQIAPLQSQENHLPPSPINENKDV